MAARRDREPYAAEGVAGGIPDGGSARGPQERGAMGRLSNLVSGNRPVVLCYFPAASSFRKKSTVWARPSRSGIVGSQPSVALARVMSGRRRTGSSCGSGWKTISDVEPASSLTIVASSRIVNSPGLPRFTGPTSSSWSIIAIIPVTRSST